MKGLYFGICVPAIAAMFAVSIFLISCGTDEIKEITWDDKNNTRGMGAVDDENIVNVNDIISTCFMGHEDPYDPSLVTKNGISCADLARHPDDIPPPESSSSEEASGGVPSSSSEGETGGGNSSSSSSNGGSEPPITSSSSGSDIVGGDLSCQTVTQTVTAGTAITPPKVRCGAVEVAAGDITWQGNPDWANPLEGTYNAVKAVASCGGESKPPASCGGTITVTRGSSSSVRSSSSALPSSSSALPSSSSALPSSSSATTLTCANVPTTGTVGTAITAPVVRCGTTTVTTGITWAGTPSAPIWASPTAGTYTNVRATATCGGSSQTANCTGTLTVSAAATPSSSSSAPVSSSSAPAPTLSCGTVPSSGTAGTAITPPTVSCSAGAVGNLTWSASSAINWTNPAAGTYSNIRANASCGSTTGLQANCTGTLTVSAAPAGCSLPAAPSTCQAPIASNPPAFSKTACIKISDKCYKCNPARSDDECANSWLWNGNQSDAHWMTEVCCN